MALMIRPGGNEAPVHAAPPKPYQTTEPRATKATLRPRSDRAPSQIRRTEIIAARAALIHRLAVVGLPDANGQLQTETVARLAGMFGLHKGTILATIREQRKKSEVAQE